MTDLLKSPAAELTLHWPSQKRRVIVDLAKLDPGMIRVLFKLKPEILDARFYTKSVTERLIEMDPRQILQSHGDLHKPYQTPDLSVMPADLSHHDEIFEPNRLGDPRDPDVVIRWLGKLSTRLKTIVDKRNNARLKSLSSLDDEIFEWIGRLGKAAVADPGKFVVFTRDDAGDATAFQIDYSHLPLKADDPVRGKALKQRLEQLWKTDGAAGEEPWLKLQYPLRTCVTDAAGRIALARMQRDLEMAEPGSLPEAQLTRWALR